MGVIEPFPADRQPYTIPRPIEQGDNLEAFDCGKAPLSDFLKQRALKNEGRASRTYVVRPTAGENAGDVVAYYSLSAGAVSHDEAPRWAKRNMPDPLPVMVLGRLAVDKQHQGNGLGRALLKEAMQRTLEATQRVGARALIVHALDEEAVNFYTGYGFRRFPTDSRTMFLPIETILQAL